MTRRLLLGFVAGFIATLVFHQIALWILAHFHWIDRAPWNMKPVPPFGVPSVISLAFWGGVWGAVMIALLAKSRYLLLASTIFGAVLPTLVAGLIIQPMIKHQPMPHSGKMVAVGLIVNGAWGLGTALIYLALERRRPRRLA
jgi:hypothetical protein